MTVRFEGICPQSPEAVQDDVGNTSGLLVGRDEARLAPAWDDLRFPFTGQRLDSASTRYSYDSDECSVQFDTNARYPEEVICGTAQLQHDWYLESALHPHIHWQQGSDYDPNWLFQYRVWENGAVKPSWVLAIPLTKRTFTYPGSGEILQLTTFPLIVMAGIVSVSCCIDWRFFRDTGNVSTLFAGAESTSDRLVKELDFHYQRDGVGSHEEYAK